MLVRRRDRDRSSVNFRTGNGLVSAWHRNRCDGCSAVIDKVRCRAVISIGSYADELGTSSIAERGKVGALGIEATSHDVGGVAVVGANVWLLKNVGVGVFWSFAA